MAQVTHLFVPLGVVGALPAGVAGVALGTGVLATVLAALVGDMSEEGRKGMMMGGLATAGDVGSALGPPLAYALAVTLGLRWVYLCCALALASGLVAVAAQGRGPVKT